MSKAKVNGVELYYEIMGEGEPVAFLNGILMTTDRWSGETEFLKTKYKCILHDTRGQFRSEKPEGDYTMELHAEDFISLLDHLDIEKCHIVGTSYGGEIGMIFAYTYPERVKSLSVIGSVSSVDIILHNEIQAWANASKVDLETFMIILRGIYSEKFLIENETYLKQREELIKKVPEEFFAAFLKLAKAAQNLDITEKIKSIKCPTLIICGEDDTITTPRHHRIIADAIPDSELLFVHGAAHALVMEKPDLIATLLHGFIERNR